jgi:hypothetical protein
MPYYDQISHSLSQDSMNNIRSRCMSMSSLYDVDPAICGQEMDIARSDYEFVMNKCIFDANILNRTNFKSLKILGIPKEAFPPLKKVPLYAIVEVNTCLLINV